MSVGRVVVRYEEKESDTKCEEGENEPANHAQVKQEELHLVALHHFHTQTDSILTADFNSTEDDPIFAPLHQVMMSARKIAPISDTYATYNAFSSSVKGSGSIIDHIFYSSGLKVKEYKTVRDGWKNIDYISDHYPIYAIFTF